MSSQLTGTRHLIPYFGLPASKSTRCTSLLESLRLPLRNVFTIVFVMCTLLAGLAIVRFGLPVSIHRPVAPSPVHSSWIANLLPIEKKPASIKETMTCIERAPTVYQAPFSNCPSLLLNYATASNGPINPKDFTVYTGVPEANNEAQYYSDAQSNISTENGSLVLRALSSPTNGYRYTSARINTLGKHDFQYGKLSIRAIIPAGSGTWPAIWMLPTDNKYKYAAYESPNRDLNDGEIDIAEAVGIEPNVVYGVAHSLAHPATGSGDYFSKTTIADNASVFHDYGLEWTPTQLTFTVDGNPFYSITKLPNATFESWPYDQRFHLIINLAVGGNWAGQDRAHFPIDGVDPSALPATLKIQSITYYRYIAP
jgi:hypothetical protein